MKSSFFTTSKISSVLGRYLRLAKLKNDWTEYWINHDYYEQSDELRLRRDERLVEKVFGGNILMCTGSLKKLCREFWDRFQNYLRKCDVNVVDTFFLNKSVNPYVKNRWSRWGRKLKWIRWEVSQSLLYMFFLGTLGGLGWLAIKLKPTIFAVCKYEAIKLSRWYQSPKTHPEKAK